MINSSDNHHKGFGQQELLKSHGLTESESGPPSDGDRGQRRERLTERKKLHQLKRDHERQEGTKRKVLRLNEGQEDGLSSGSDSEKAGRSKKRKQDSEQNVDIQVKSIEKKLLSLQLCDVTKIQVKARQNIITSLTTQPLCRPVCLPATGGEVQVASQHVGAAGGGQRQPGLVLPQAVAAEAAALQRPLPSAGSTR